MYTSQTVTQQVNQIPPQASPTGSSNSRPSPPSASLPRHLATPPQASTSPGEIGVPPSLSQIPQNHGGYGAHYNHTITRAQAASLTRYQSFDDDYHITPELLEEIERADLQQAQTQTGSPAFTNYPRNGSTSPPRDHNMDRVRTVGDRASPKDLDSRRQRDSLPARESPVVRQPHSPSSFAQAQGSQPDRRASNSPARSSPLGGGSSGETYTAYMTRDSPPVHRRTVNVVTSEPRSQYALTNQTPPLQTRSSDRSLPVQEEPEDDPRLVVKDDPWKGLEHLENRHRNSSPTPSSDLHPEGNPQLFKATQSVPSRADQYLEGSDDEGAKTPRSPSVGLPDKNAQPITLSARAPVRMAGRTGPMDQLGLRGIDETIYQPNVTMAGPSHSSNVQRGGQHAQQRKLSVDPNHQYHQNQYYADESSPYSGLYHHGAQFHPDEYYTYGDPSSHYYHDLHYTERPRPDAPIPPTPHSQTTAPSPSPFPHMYARNGRNFAAPSPVAPAGSPYPAPFEHVRRNMMSRNARPVLDPHDPNFDINMIRDQVAGQWQKFAQNTHALGNMSDSTFSPSTTPFQGNFAPWATLHARRTLGRAFDLRSMQSSPGLERSERVEQLPVPPPSVFRSKKKNRTSKLSSEIPTQALPPRVQSTQPRDTSPEPSTSGEETAGEDQYSVNNPSRNSWGNGSVDRVVEDDGDGEWVDEDEEPDEDDLLELEYHPSYVKNIAKRRRRWETGWEGLLEAVSVTFWLMGYD